ncbi:MAG TPA: hypothetical protein VK922_16040 [Gemmatimonadaceae bacterium]|nr:hypothetical protein [Gemmatimonadaceae bacterium]
MTRARNGRHAAPIAVACLVAMAHQAAGAQQRSADAAVLLEAAQHQETIAGNLDSAMALYRRIASDRRASRGVVAQALVRLGGAYETLGDVEARRTYERVVGEYADQTAAARVARERLSAMARPAVASAADGPVARRLWAGPEVDLMGAPSPDGRLLTFTDWSTGELAVYDLTTGRSRPLTRSGPWSANDDYAETSIWSPDGRQVAYTWYTNDDQYELRVIGAEGGSPRTLVANPDVDYLWPDAWSPDGRYILTILRRPDRSSQLALVSAADGSLRVLKTFDWRWPLQTSISPDGRWIAYDFPPAEDQPERDIYLLAADGSREQVIVRHPADERLLGWTPDGSGLVFTTNRRGTRDLAVIAVSGGEARGEPRIVKSDVGPLAPLGIARGNIYYGASFGGRDVYLGRLEPSTGTIETEPSRLPVRVEGRNHHPSWSPDGSMLAWIAEPVTPGAPRMVEIRDLESGAERQLPIFNFLRVFELEWSPDQRTLYILGNNRKDGIGLFSLELASGAQGKVVQPDEGVIGRRPDARMFAVARDGGSLIYSTLPTESSPARLVRYELASGSVTVLHEVPGRKASVHGIALSPNGTDVAFGVIDGVPVGRTAAYVVPVTGGPARLLVEHDTPLAPVGWLDEGRTLLYEADPPNTNTERPHRHELWTVPAAGGTPRKLPVEVDAIQNVRVHPDGRRFVFAKGAAQSEVWVLENALPRSAEPR